MIVRAAAADALVLAPRGEGTLEAGSPVRGSSGFPARERGGERLPGIARGQPRGRMRTGSA